MVCDKRTPKVISDELFQILLHLENYPKKSCIRLAQPYAACNVVKDLYENMFTRWKKIVSYFPQCKLCCDE